VTDVPSGLSLTPPQKTIKKKNKKVVGIVSWGIGCGNKKFPALYVDVSALKSWVTALTGVS
jgi:secreted trypsin-like serine protease